MRRQAQLGEVDVALVTDATASERYLLGVTTPEDGWLCPGLVDIAAATLHALVAAED